MQKGRITAHFANLRSLGRAVCRGCLYALVAIRPAKSVLLRQGKRQGVSPVSGPALCHHCSVQLFGQSKAWHRESHATTFCQSDAHVFYEVLDEEAWVEIVIDDPGCQVG